MIESHPAIIRAEMGWPDRSRGAAIMSRCACKMPEPHRTDDGSDYCGVCTLVVDPIRYAERLRLRARHLLFDEDDWRGAREFLAKRRQVLEDFDAERAAARSRS